MLVWNHKKHTYRPTLVPEDKIIKQFRMWYAQFYRKKITISYSTDQWQLEKCIHPWYQVWPVASG